MKYRVAGRVVGTLQEDGTLVKRGKQVMLFRMYDGFAVANTVLNDPSVQRIEVHYEGQVYRAGYRDFLEDGIPYQRPPFEAQLVLPRRYWNREGTAQAVLWEEATDAEGSVGALQEGDSATT